MSPTANNNNPYLLILIDELRRSTGQANEATAIATCDRSHEYQVYLYSSESVITFRRTPVSNLLHACRAVFANFRLRWIANAPPSANNTTKPFLEMGTVTRALHWSHSTIFGRHAGGSAPALSWRGLNPQHPVANTAPLPCNTTAAERTPVQQFSQPPVSTNSSSILSTAHYRHHCAHATSANARHFDDGCSTVYSFAVTMSLICLHSRVRISTA